jgi:hypothetical protein
MVNYGEMLLFTEWCLSNDRYRFDIQGKFWFDSKTLNKLTWEEIIEKYKESGGELEHAPKHWKMGV